MRCRIAIGFRSEPLAGLSVALAARDPRDARTWRRGWRSRLPRPFLLDQDAVQAKAGPTKTWARTHVAARPSPAVTGRQAAAKLAARFSRPAPHRRVWSPPSRGRAEGDSVL